MKICKNCDCKNSDDAVFCTSCGKQFFENKTCISCGKEIEEDSVYCRYCGTKLISENHCPSCGKEYQEGAVYCTSCGSRIDGKNQCVSCGELFEGSFCPKCGTPTQKWIDTISAKANPNKKSFNKEKFNKIFEKTGYSLLLTGVVFAFIFVFLIAFTATIKTNINKYYLSSILNQYGISAKANMYYYFGDVYKDIETAKEAMNSDTVNVDYTTPSLYISAILGTVIASASILAVTILSILAVIQIIRKLKGKDVKNAEKLSLGSILSFILGATLLHAINNVTLNFKEESMDNLSVSVNFAPETLAGIILCAIFMGLGFVCFAIKNRCEYKDVKNLCSSILGIISVVFAVVVVSVASMGVFTMLKEDSYNSVLVTLPATSVLTTWAQYLQLDPSLNSSTYAEIIVWMFIQVAVICLGIAFLIKQTNYLIKNEKSSSWCVGIALLIVSCSYMGLAISIKNETIAIMENSGTEYSITVTSAILIFVFSLLTLVGATAKKLVPVLLTNKKVVENKENVA